MLGVLLASRPPGQRRPIRGFRAPVIPAAFGESGTELPEHRASGEPPSPTSRRDCPSSSSSSARSAWRSSGGGRLCTSPRPLRSPTAPLHVQVVRPNPVRPPLLPSHERPTINLCGDARSESLPGRCEKLERVSPEANLKSEEPSSLSEKFDQVSRWGQTYVIY
jgi:hypothetical protein